jgi:hypothetical protein
MPGSVPAHLVHVLTLMIMPLRSLLRLGDSKHRVLNAGGFQKTSETVLLGRLFVGRSYDWILCFFDCWLDGSVHSVFTLDG